MASGSGLVVVIGAGPAGAAAARLLATGGRDVLLVDDGHGSVDRIEMLPPAAIVTFKAAGFGPLLDDPSVASPCMGVIRGSDREDFISRPGGRGFAVHRPAFDRALRSAAVAAGAELRIERLVAAASASEGVDLSLASCASRKRLRAEVVVDATGRAAAVARRLGGRITTFERLTAQRIAAPADSGPWLTFAPECDGWRYALGGPEGLVDAWRVSGKKMHTARAVDASARVLEPAAGARWIAIGDASAAFDPICCQGLAHAAGTAVTAARLIIEDGTIGPETAECYDLACSRTARMTELRRRAVYATFGRHETRDGLSRDGVVPGPMNSDPIERWAAR